VKSLENLLVASLAIVTLVHDLAHCELICHALDTTKDIHTRIAVVGGIVNKLFPCQASDTFFSDHAKSIGPEAEN
jgi:hypothetical protein